MSKNIINEAIPISKAKEWGLTKKKSGAYKIPILNQVFGDRSRLVYDLPIEVNHEKLIEMGGCGLKSNYHAVRVALFKLNYVLNRKSYVKGFAYKVSEYQEGKRIPYKIGKILQKNNQLDTLKLFKEDEIRQLKSGDYKVVISRHPYDVAGISTDRNWTSCMRLPGSDFPVYKKTFGNFDQGGSYNEAVFKDIEHGSIVAYLVSDKDRHENGKLAVRKPLTRILMKPFQNENGEDDYAYSYGDQYKLKFEDFSNFIKNWLDENINTDTNGKTYRWMEGLYDDDDADNVSFKVTGSPYQDDEEHYQEQMENVFNDISYSRVFNVHDLEFSDGEVFVQFSFSYVFKYGNSDLAEHADEIEQYFESLGYLNDTKDSEEILETILEKDNIDGVWMNYTSVDIDTRRKEITFDAGYEVQSYTLDANGFDDFIGLITAIEAFDREFNIGRVYDYFEEYLAANGVIPDSEDLNERYNISTFQDLCKLV